MNYIGSKHSLINFLEDTIYNFTGYKKGDPFVFGDLFAGTGVVGKRFKENGCNVISNDIQYYSYVLNRHYIENNEEINLKLETELNNLPPIKGFIYQNYCEGSGSGRKYFTDYNGMKCDAIREHLDNLRESNAISNDTYFHYLASLINSIDKYANTASVYGAFLKEFKNSAKKEFKLEMLPVIKGIGGRAYNEDINKLITNIEGDVLYLDPPYNARQYCTNYHVLETIALNDHPLVKGKTGLRNYKEQKSEFCSKKDVIKSFHYLIKNAKFNYIFLSYNNEGLMDLDTIKEIMSYYGGYMFVTNEYKRFKADKEINRNYLTNSTIEYIHCLKKG